MNNNDNSEFKLAITQDKLIDILLHAATRDDISKLDDKIATHQVKFDKKLDYLNEKIEVLQMTLVDSLIKLDIKFDGKLDKLETKFDDKLKKFETKFDNKFEKFDNKLHQITNKQDKMLWMMTTAILVPLMLHFIK